MSSLPVEPLSRVNARVPRARIRQRRPVEITAVVVTTVLSPGERCRPFALRRRPILRSHREQFLGRVRPSGTASRLDAVAYNESGCRVVDRRSHHPPRAGKEKQMSPAAQNVEKSLDQKDGQSFAETAMRLGGKSEEEARRMGAVDKADEQVESLFEQ